MGREMGGRGWGLQIHRIIVQRRSRSYTNITQSSGPAIPTEGTKQPSGLHKSSESEGARHVLENTAATRQEKKDVSQWAGHCAWR